jgi:hypothetical protein
VIEDDGRVAYAYLLEREKIVTDVWLYNVAPTPSRPAWNDPREMPFLNAPPYCAPHDLRITKDTPIQTRWSIEGVELIVDGTLLARLARDVRPGWSRFARRAGPCAKPLDS